MKLILDTNKEYGLVLEGGGARGAYQIGAWKALKEAGIQIKGVSGSSVGTLNGALICMGDLERAERIWKNISYTQVMDIKEGLMEGILKKDFTNLSRGEVIKEMFHSLLDGGFDVTPLKNLIQANIEEKKIREGKIEFYFQVFSMTEKKELELDARKIAEEDMVDMILASAYFPAFKVEEIHGNKLIDAGMFNNVPIDALLKRKYQNIIVIRIFGMGVEKKVDIPDEVCIIEIAPRVDLGNILEFEKEKSMRNIKLGYFDAMRVLYDLKGKIYYIDAQLDEMQCLNLLLEECAEWDEIFTLYGIELAEENKKKRLILENLFPLIADELKLEKNWGYDVLYLSILEASARFLHVQKYNIYTEEELLKEIWRKWEERESTDNKEEKIPNFMKYLLKMKNIASDYTS